MISTVSPTLFERLAGFFFGRDIFVSYSYRDSAYAEALAVALGKRFSVFLGAWGATPGEKLSRRVAAAARRSRLLVVVATPRARTSKAVADEIGYFTRQVRPIVPVDLGLGLHDPKQEWPELAGTDVIRESKGSDPSCARPSDAVIERIINSASFMRQETRLRRFLAATALSVAALVAGATVWITWSADVARVAKREAENSSVIALAMRHASRRLKREATSALEDRNRAVTEKHNAERLRNEAAAAAERESSIGLSIRMANEANAFLAQPERLGTAALLAIQSVSFLQKRQVRALAADAVLRNVLQLLPWVDRRSSIRTQQKPLRLIASPSGRWLLEQNCLDEFDLIDTEMADRVHVSIAAEGVGSPLAYAFAEGRGLLAGAFEPPYGREATFRTKILTWDIATNKLLKAVSCDVHVDALTLSRDGTYIAYSGGRDVRVIRMTDGHTEAATTLGQYVTASELEFSTTGNVLALTSFPRAMVWPWHAVADPIACKAEAPRVFFNPADEEIVATQSRQLSVWRWRDWTTPNASPLWSADDVSPSDRSAVAFSPNGETLAFLKVAQAQAHVIRWREPTRLSVVVPLGRQGRQIAVVDDGWRIAVGFDDGTVESLPVLSGEPIARAVHGSKVLAVTIQPNGTVRSLSTSGSMTWRPASREPLLPRAMSAAAVSADGTIVVVAEPRFIWHGAARNIGRISVYDDWMPPVEQTTEDSWISSTFAADGSLYAGMADGNVCRWASAHDLRPLSRVVVAHASAPVTSMAAGRRSIAWAADRALYIKHGASPARVLHTFFSPIKTLAFARTADVLAAGTAGGDVYVWNFGEGSEPARIFKRHERVESIALTSDGTYVAAAGGVETGDIWSTAGKSVHYQVPGDAASALAFEPFGESLAVGSVNGFVHIWNNWRDHAVEVARFYDGWDVTVLRFSDDGRYLVSLPLNGSGHRRAWRTDDMLAAACRRLGQLDTSGELAGYGSVCGQVAAWMGAPPTHTAP
jgi:WD40 repeat protein